MAWVSSFTPEWRVVNVLGAAANQATENCRVVESQTGTFTYVLGGIDQDRYALRMDSNAASANISLYCGVTQQITGMIARFRVESAFTTNCDFMRVIASTAGESVVLRVSNAGVLQYSMNNGGAYTTIQNIARGQTYCIELYIDWTAGTTHTLKVRLDGVEVLNTTGGTAIVTSSTARYGMTGASVGMLVDFADMAVYTAAAEYGSLACWRVVGLEPMIDGQHSFTADDFQDAASANLTPSSTGTFAHVDDAPTGVPSAASPFVKQVVVRTTGYLEWLMRPLPFGLGAPLHVSMAGAFHPVAVVTGGFNECACQLVADGVATAYATADTSLTADTLEYRLWRSTTAPGGGAFTVAQARQPFRTRWGYAGDVAPVPAVDSIMLFVLAPVESPQGDPEPRLARRRPGLIPAAISMFRALSTLDQQPAMGAGLPAALGGTIGQVEEADSALAVGHLKTTAVGLASETDTALAVGRLKQRTLGQITETDLAQAVAHTKRLAIGQVSETDTAQALTAVKPTIAYVAPIPMQDAALFDAASGATFSTSGVRSQGGSHLAEFAATGAAKYAQLNHTGKRETIDVFYFRRRNTPSANANIFTVFDAGANALLRLTTGNTIEAVIGGSTSAASAALTLDQWYRICVRVVVTGGVTTLSWWLDGVAQAGTNLSQADVDLTGSRIGVNSAVTATVQFMDWVGSYTSVDAPLGIYRSKLYDLATVVGANHVLGAGSFQKTGAVAITASDSTSHAELTEKPLATTSYVRQTANDAAAWLEYPVGDSAESVPPRCVSVGILYNGGGAGTYTCEVRAYDGTTEGSDLLSGLTKSGTTARYKLAQLTSPPSGGDWTDAKLDAFRIRFGFSGDAAPDPQLCGLAIVGAFPGLGAAPVHTVNVGLVTETDSAGPPGQLYGGVSLRTTQADTQDEYTADPWAIHHPPYLLWSAAQPDVTVAPDFSSIANSIKHAIDFGYKTPIRLVMGVESPDLSGAPYNVEYVKHLGVNQYPLPWDSTYLSYARAFVAALEAFLSTTWNGKSYRSVVGFVSVACTTTIGTEMSVGYADATSAEWDTADGGTDEATRQAEYIASWQDDLLHYLSVLSVVPISVAYGPVWADGYVGAQAMADWAVANLSSGQMSRTFWGPTNMRVGHSPAAGETYSDWDAGAAGAMAYIKSVVEPATGHMWAQSAGLSWWQGSFTPGFEQAFKNAALDARDTYGIKIFETNVNITADATLDPDGSLEVWLADVYQPTLITANVKGVTALKSKTLGQVTEADSALVMTHSIRRTLGLVTEADSAQAFAHAKQKAIGQAVETDAAQAVTAERRRSIGQITETDSARSVTPQKGQTLGVVSEADLAQPVTGAKRLGIGLVSEVDSSRGMTAQKSLVLGQVTEADVAQGPIGHSRQLQTGRAIETDAAQPLTHTRQVGVGQVTEADSALVFTVAKQKLIGQVVETNTAGAVTRLVSALGYAEEVDTAQALAAHTKQQAIGLVSEADAAQALTRSKRLLIGLVAEADSAQTLAVRKQLAIGQATETNTAQSLAHAKQQALGLASEADAAQALTRVKQRTIGLVSETDEAQAVTIDSAHQVGLALEADAAQPVGHVKAKSIGQVNEADTARAVTTQKRVLIGLVTETDAAQALAPSKQQGVGQAVETDAARPVGQAKRLNVGQISEGDEARPVAHAFRRTLGQVLETDAAQGVARLKQQGVARAVETDAARPITIAMAGHVGQVTEDDVATLIGKHKTVFTGRVLEVDAARPFIILGGRQVFKGRAGNAPEAERAGNAPEASRLSNSPWEDDAT